MCPKSKNAPECGCNQTTLIDKEIVKQDADNITGIVTAKTWIQGYCEIHKCYGGKPRGYKETKTSVDPFNPETIISEKELELVKYVLVKTFNSSAIGENAAIKIAVEKGIVESENDARRLIERLCSKGIIIGGNTSRSDPSWRLTITPEAQQFLSDALGIHPKESKYQPWIDLIDQSIASTASIKLSSSQDIIKQLLLKERARLIGNDPGFFETEDKMIVPQNVLYQRPVYEILIRTLCKWLEIWKPLLTVRELSARSVKSIALAYAIDPSKLVEKYWNQFDSVIFHECQSSFNSLGLIRSLDLFTYSGVITASIPGITENDSDKLFKTISNFSLLANPDTMLNVKAENILCTENLAAFTFISNVFHESKNVNWLVIYKGGYKDDFVIDVLHILIRDNKFSQLVFWFDNDYGGVDMFNKLLVRLRDFGIDITNEPSVRFLYRIPPGFENDMYDRKQKNLLTKLRERACCDLVKDACDYITNHESVEQEVFLSNYETYFIHNDVHL